MLSRPKPAPASAELDETVAAPPKASPAVAPPSGDAMIGREIIGQFVVRSKLGEGGMGSVYLADQPSVGRSAVIKVLHPQLSRNQQIAARFSLEARAASRLNHPNIVTIYNHGTMDDGALFLAMEHIDGVCLRDLLVREKRLAAPRAVRIARQIASALVEAHRNDIVHRDLKPNNVMVVARPGGEDFVKVLDFGIAKVQGVELTASGMLCGTPIYMSPEQFGGDKIDGRSDLYSLGILLFEMLAGDPPFAAATPAGYMNKHLSASPPRIAQTAPTAHVPERLDALVRRMLAKDPADRPASLQALLDELDKTMGAAASAPPPNVAPSAPAPRATPAPPAAQRTPETSAAPHATHTASQIARIESGLREGLDRTSSFARRAWRWLIAHVVAGARWTASAASHVVHRRKKRTLSNVATSLLQGLRPRRRTVWSRARDAAKRVPAWWRRVKQRARKAR